MVSGHIQICRTEQVLSYKQIIQYCFGREFIISVENQNPCPYSDTQIITGDVGELNNQVFLFIFFIMI